MEEDSLVPECEQFLRQKEVMQALIEACEEGKGSITIDFMSLDRFNPALAERLLEEPEKVLQAFSEAINNIELPPHEPMEVRVKNLPKSRNIRIRNLRAKHIGKLVEIEGVVKAASEVRPQIYEAVFQCPECGNLIPVEQDSPTLKQPTMCECGRRGIFKLVEKKMYDIRWLTVNEPFEITSGEPPSKINVLLKKDLTTPEMQRKSDPGNQLRIVGILKEIPKRVQGKISTRPEIYFEAVYIESKEEEFEEVKITEEDKKRIHELAKRSDIYDILIASIAPGIYGWEEIKEAILLQLFGGIRHEFEDGTHVRGNIHILITGDPSTAKSVLISNVVKALPRGRYVSGKGVTGAGLTTTVVKNELLGGWVLEAGALILANNSILAIDEFDKMSKEDQIAMHEAMSLESYHGDFVITLADGSRKKIGEVVEDFFRRFPERIRKGIDCEWVDLSEGELELLVSDLKNVRRASAIRVSRHKAPKRFYKVELETGRSVIVTPHHPFIVFENGKFTKKPIEKLKVGDFVPIVTELEVEGKMRHLDSIALTTGVRSGEHLPRGNWRKEIKMPMHNSPEFCKWLGYLVSEGSHEINRGKINGVNFTNSDELLLGEFRELTAHLFGLTPYTQKKKGRTMLRYTSKALINFLHSIEPKLLANAWEKRLPSFVFGCKNNEIKQLLRSLFEGDGSLIDTKKGIYVTYTTSSDELAEQIHELLLRFGIVGRIVKVEKPSRRSKRRIYRIVIKGKRNLENFLRIGFINEKKNEKIRKRLALLKGRTCFYEKIPCGKVIAELLRLLKLSQKKAVGYTLTYHESGDFCFNKYKVREILERVNRRLEEMKACLKEIEKAETASQLRNIRKRLGFSAREIARLLSCSHQLVSLRELRGGNKIFVENYKRALRNHLTGIIGKAEELIEDLKKITAGNIALCKVKKIEVIENESEKWSYDVSVPGKLFVSAGAILHNTVSVAKASIVATLPARTAILAAANPKLGRFDPYLSILEQIDIPETLLTRFDLKFALRDVPDKTRDRELVEHVTASRMDKDVARPVLDLNFLRKYIVYARKTITDIKLTDEAAEILKNFYVELRNRYSGDKVPTVPITLRQYEALIRLAEASAKVRLDNFVRKEDAERAIRLMKVSLQQLGIDVDTGRIDIDKIESGITSSQRSKMRLLLEIISELEEKLGKNIPIEDVKAAAEEQGIDNVDELLERLKNEGLIFMPRAGHIRKV